MLQLWLYSETLLTGKVLMLRRLVGFVSLCQIFSIKDHNKKPSMILCLRLQIGHCAREVSLPFPNYIAGITTFNFFSTIGAIKSLQMWPPMLHLLPLFACDREIFPRYISSIILSKKRRSVSSSLCHACTVPDDPWLFQFAFEQVRFSVDGWLRECQSPGIGKLIDHFQVSNKYIFDVCSEYQPYYIWWCGGIISPSPFSVSF